MSKRSWLFWVCVLIAMATGPLLVSPSLAKGKPPKDNDTTPPDAITDLLAISTGYGAMQLRFTAVGDDGGGTTCLAGGKQIPPASAYDIRYSTSAIQSNADFAAATQMSGEPDPLSCGATERICLDGLQGGTTYYIAVKVIDDAGNVSGLSNVASAAAGADLGDYMHVHDVLIQWGVHGNSRPRWAVVRIRDENGVPVGGATVAGVWSGDFRGGTSSGVTNGCGVANLDGGKIQPKGGGYVTFTVTNVTHAYAQYDPDANVETSDTKWVQ